MTGVPPVSALLDLLQRRYDIDDPLYRHLPGKHNQQSHAGKKKAKPTAKPAAPSAAPSGGTKPLKKGPGGYRDVSPAGADKLHDQMTADRPWSDAERQTLTDYSASDGRYKQINGTLRGQRPPDAKTTTEIDHMRSAMRELPGNITVHRDMTPDAFGFSGKKLTASQAASLTGRTFSDRGFSSTSVSTRATRAVQMRISVPKGTRAAYVDSISRNRGEHEMILDRGTHFRIDRVEQITRGSLTDTILHVTVVGQDG